ncbi:protein of unknown function [Kyrpidia spormannii]|uniref:Uncharacterized protein n=2 Tax=Kyrpidia spormannii TaxID=2055160 RepID=A0ACA8Z5Y6_9BACL|nr:protein of unknown function [Kyrpidia spormannii]CAB3389780.1 protein of unknown function [Kyrpidia spormannii]
MGKGSGKDSQDQAGGRRSLNFKKENLRIRAQAAISRKSLAGVADGLSFQRGRLSIEWNPAQGRQGTGN